MSISISMFMSPSLSRYVYIYAHIVPISISIALSISRGSGPRPHLKAWESLTGGSGASAGVGHTIFSAVLDVAIAGCENRDVEIQHDVARRPSGIPKKHYNFRDGFV